MEGNVVLSVNLAVQKWGNFIIALQFSVRALEWIDAEDAIRIEEGFRLAEQCGDFEKCVFASPAGNVNAGRLLGIFFGAGHGARGRRSKREIAIQEFFEKYRPCADLSFSPAVIGNKESNVL